MGGSLHPSSIAMRAAARGWPHSQSGKHSYGITITNAMAAATMMNLVTRNLTRLISDYGDVPAGLNSSLCSGWASVEMEVAI